MTLVELLRRARESTPREGMTPASLLEWRGRIFALRHALPDGSRGAEVADALVALAASTILLLEGDEEPLVHLQDHVWRFSRVKGNTTEEAAAAADEIHRRLASLPLNRRRVFIADLYRILLTAEFDLLAKAMEKG